MPYTGYKAKLSLAAQLMEAQARKEDYENRLTELMKPRPNEQARMAFIDRIAEDLNAVMHEIEGIKRKLEAER